MKVKHILFAIICCLISILALPTHFASADSAQNFYFKDFQADYYLTRASDGTSNLHVKETMTAVFPESSQNHGISRIIPYSNQDNTNRTILNQDAMHLTVFRNGKSEPVDHIDRGSGAYIIYIGSASEYVHGEQTYTLEYDFSNVITEFDSAGKNVSGQDVVKAFQELYWDTNGNGWRQRFDHLVANVHLSREILSAVIPADTSCYVGAYGAKGNERCTISTMADGFSFAAQNLAAGENLSFAIRFQPDTFVFKYEESFLLLILLVIEIAIAGAIIYRLFIKWRRESWLQYHLYKTLFTAPQYLPPPESDFHVAEASHLYIKKTRSPYVATILELAVTKAITITKTPDEKNSDKSTWSIHVNADPSTMSIPQVSVLKIFADKKEIQQGDDILVKKHKYSSSLSGYLRAYDTQAEATIKKAGYIKKQQMKTSVILILAILALFFLPEVIVSAFSTSEYLDYIINYTRPVGGRSLLISLIFLVMVIAIVAATYLSSRTRKFYPYTESGIRQVKYLEGLELYIKMAEAERIKFLQSVKGADTSNHGIVKLYEKLLPWACLFGVEESWLRELQKYYEIDDEPGVFDTNLITGMAFYNMTRDLNRTINSTINYYSSSGGGRSSSSSGGGGGGFSGGGGGGGGGGGW